MSRDDRDWWWRTTEGHRTAGKRSGEARRQKAIRELDEAMALGRVKLERKKRAAKYDSVRRVLRRLVRPTYRGQSARKALRKARRKSK